MALLAPRPGAAQAADTTPPPTTTSQECCIELFYPLSARILALGGAVVADTAPDMVLSNPAGLVGLHRPELVVHYRRSTATELQVLGLSFVTRPYRFGTFALSYMLTDYGTVQGTDISQNPTGTTYSQVHVVFATFATSLLPGVSGGLTYKVYVWITPNEQNAQNGGASGTTQMVDLGLQYHPRWNRWLALGASLVNAGIPLQVVNFEQANKAPVRGRLGARYELLHLFHPDTTVTGSVSAELEVGDPSGLIPALGGEVTVGGVVSLRAGWRGGSAGSRGVQSGAALGVGLHIQRYTLAVARSLSTGPLDVGSAPFNITFGVSF